MPILNQIANGSPLLDVRDTLNNALNGLFLSSYTGQVATRCFLPKLLIGTTGRYFNSRTLHRAMDDITSLQAEFPNFYLNGSFQETATGAAATIEAFVEYPMGTYTRIQFGGVNAGSIPNGGRLLSDACAVTIPRGSVFAIRTNIGSTVALPYHADHVPVSGEGFEASASPLTNKAGSGTIAQGTNAIYGPCAIIAATRRPSFALIGDSKVVGSLDNSAVNMDVGNLARSVGPHYAYTKVATSGDTAQAFAASNTNRAAIAARCWGRIIALGINDFAAGRTAAQIGADIATIIALNPTQPTWVCTISPKTTGTFADLAGQTVTANEANRVSFNTNLRLGAITGVSSSIRGVIDLADAVESGPNSGKWRPGLTGDGTHENTTGALAIRESNVIAALTRFR